MRSARMFSLLAALVAPACRERPPADPPLYPDLGTLHVPISSRSELAGRYFDQGMRLTYAFNHAEAIRSFEQAAALDPSCAICWWGVALAAGPNINAPIDSAGVAIAWRAIGKARALAPRANPREQRLIEALATRYAEPPGGDRARLDSAYATAMARVVAELPGDTEAATLYAEALMDLRPWAYWDGPGRPAPGTTALKRVIAADSTHPGACHYYIHALEAVEPARALPCAERLARLMPGAGHLVHMPAHIYIRVGRYQDAIAHNEHATHADSTFALTERVSPAYASIYVPHNFHFLAFAAMLAGDTARAVTAARATVEKVPPAAAVGLPDFQAMVAVEHQMLAKFGRWNEVLALPLPGPHLPVGRAVAESSRGLAHLALGRVDSARALLDSVTNRVSAVEASEVSPIAKGVARIAQRVLAAGVARSANRPGDAIRELEAAVEIEDGLGYMEPPYWIDPVRQSLGELLLATGRREQAAQVFRMDLERFPGNVWSTAGLERTGSS